MDTLEALLQLGFVPDADSEKFVYDFGNFELTAIQSMNRSFVEVIYVTGVFYDKRSLCNVEIQLPLRVASIELCTTFIASGIERQIGNFTSSIQTDWLETGRNNFDLLPWMREQKRYKERPRCLADRDWLKLAIRDLSLHQEELGENDSLFLTFQKGIFSIRSPLKVIAFPAAGEDWNFQYEIIAGKLRNLPKRINNKEIEISVWNDYLFLANRGYPVHKIIDTEI